MPLPSASDSGRHAIESPDLRGRQTRVDKQTWDYVIRSGLAGGLAGCAAKTVVGPLDRVKILFQASNPHFQKYTGSSFGVVRAVTEIFSKDGTRGLFRGHSATLLRVFPYAGIKFLAYEQIRSVVIPDRNHETASRRFVSGSLAGILSVFCTYPLEVMRVRMAFETTANTRTSLAQTCRKIYAERSASLEPAGPATAGQVSRAVTPPGGLTNFFRGFTTTIWGMIPYAGCSFLTHDLAGDWMRHPSIEAYTTIPRRETPWRDPTKPLELRYWAELTTGGFAGFVSQTVSYPFEVIRRRMQVGGVVGDGHRLGLVEVARDIWGKRGLRGFFVGLTIGYIKVVPMAATSFFVYEKSKELLGI